MNDLVLRNSRDPPCLAIRRGLMFDVTGLRRRRGGVERGVEKRTNRRPDHTSEIREALHGRASRLWLTEATDATSSLSSVMESEPEFNSKYRRCPHRESALPSLPSTRRVCIQLSASVTSVTLVILTWSSTPTSETSDSHRG